MNIDIDISRVEYAIVKCTMLKTWLGFHLKNETDSLKAMEIRLKELKIKRKKQEDEKSG